MKQDEVDDLFSSIRGFGWDPKKRATILRDRQIDFDDLRFVLAGPTIIQRSDRKGEVRYKVFGFLEDVELVFICTFRGGLCWINTARRARRDERKEYHSRLPRRSTEGQDRS